MLSSPHQIGKCPLHNPQPFGHFSPQLFCFSLVQTWVYLTELNYIKSQIRWHSAQLTEMALTEPDWDWNWSHPAPSSGSQQCNSNQAAKKRDLALFFAVLACHNWDWAGLQQTMLKKCFASGFQVTAFQKKQQPVLPPQRSGHKDARGVLWSMAERNFSVQPDCLSADTSQLSYSIPEEALLCLWGLREDAGPMVMLAQGGLCTAAWLWSMGLLTALCLDAWADRGALQQHRKEKI